MTSTKDQSTPIRSPKDLTRVKSEAEKAFGELFEIVAALRGPQGCPWDKEQNHKSLCQFAIEEAYELVEAIESGDGVELREELGDFLFQVLLHAQIASEESRFDMADVLKTLNEKMIRRHPHVFAKGEGGKSLEQIWLKWEQTKQQENAAKGKTKPIFSHPQSMPALQAAQKIGGKTEGYKFDWDTASGALAHLESEIRELREAIESHHDLKAVEHEIGDVLFTTAQVARHMNLEPEQCLRVANRRFEERFTSMLKLSGLDKDGFRALAPAEKERLWAVAKGLTSS